MKKIIYPLFLLMFTLGCNDIFITNLSDEEVTLLTPQDQHVTNVQTQTFWWGYLKGATEYEIRIVTPNFGNPTDILVDELVTDNNYTTTLSPGTYAWRILAFNSGSNTSRFEERFFTITSDSTLTDQTIAIVAPTDQFRTRENTISLLWQPLELASRYRIAIGQPDFSHSSFTIQEDTTQADSWSVTLPEGDYVWRVRAENGQSSSQYTTANFTIDNTPPTTPTLVNPADADSLAAPFILSWNPAIDAVADSLYVYTDSLLQNILLQATTTNTSFTLTDSSSSAYYWRLKSLDDVGNVSSFSETRVFYQQ